MRRIAQATLVCTVWLLLLAQALRLALWAPGWGLVSSLFLCLGALWALDAFVPALGRGGVRRGVHGSSRAQAALTFDDGPSTDTPAVLDALERVGVRATFFMTGEHARKHPQLVREVVLRGHLVGNHTDSHRILSFLSERAVGEELDRATDALVAAGAPVPRFFRAPRGFQGPFVRRALSKRGMTLVGWTRGAWDTEDRPVEAIVELASEPPRAGDILLLHDGAAGPSGTRSRARTAEALGPIVERYRRAGIAFVRLDELLAPLPEAPER